MTTRTTTQNAAIHKYFSLLAEALNDAGYDMQKVLEHKAVSVPWNESMVKEVLWRGIQKAMFNKESTTELEINEVSEVYDVLSRHISENFGVYVPFPSNEQTGE